MSAGGRSEARRGRHDDRLPVMLVVLDGLGDRPIPELDGRTPAEAAATPNLDELAAAGASAWHVPFGWGRAPSSEIAHWSMFGFSDVPFPGRAVLEAIGAGLDVECDVAMIHAALRSSCVDGDRLWITGRAGPDDEADATALLAELGPVLARHGAEVRPLGARGEGLLCLAAHGSTNITDSDPFFENLHPWLRVLPNDPTATATAEAVTALLLDVRSALAGTTINRARRSHGVPALDVLTTKWSGTRRPLPSFVEQNGVDGAAVTSSRLYRGLAGILDMSRRDIVPNTDVAADLRARLAAAEELIDDGAQFVHVHIKATDDAGHTKDPRAKLDVLEAADAGFAGLRALATRTIVAVTGDHATPSTAEVLHTGDPSPLLIAGPTVRSDTVTEFGERAARTGWYGVVRAAELLPLLFGHANRPVFLGHRATPRLTLALPDCPEPMPAASGASVTAASGHDAATPSG